jgi:hypothetical protein
MLDTPVESNTYARFFLDSAMVRVVLKKRVTLHPSNPAISRPISSRCRTRTTSRYLSHSSAHVRSIGYQTTKQRTYQVLTILSANSYMTPLRRAPLRSTFLIAWAIPTVFSLHLPFTYQFLDNPSSVYCQRTILWCHAGLKLRVVIENDFQKIQFTCFLLAFLRDETRWVSTIHLDFIRDVVFKKYIMGW